MYEEKADIATILAVARNLKTMIDGTVRIHINVEPSYCESAMHLFGEPSVTIAVAKLTAETNQKQRQGQSATPYRQQTKY